MPAANSRNRRPRFRGDRRTLATLRPGQVDRPGGRDVELLRVMHDSDGGAYFIFDQVPLTFVPPQDEDVEFYDDSDVLLTTMDDSFLYKATMLAVTRTDSGMADGYYLLFNAPKQISFANGGLYVLNGKYVVNGDIYA